MGICTLLGHNLKMKAQKEIPTYKRHRFPIEIIRHCVWLYFRFSLSYRDVELLMTERGITVSYESIRQWCLKFGDEYALKQRKRRGQPGDKWHLDEIFIKINGKTHYLWRAVDQNGMVLDILVTRRRNKEAAKRFFLKLLRGLKYEPRVIITDKLRSYGAALREVLPQVDHRQHKGLNNRAENSHRPTRRRERVMQRFKSPEQAQRFLSPFGPIYEHFKPRRHLMKATDYRSLIEDRFQVWQDVTAATSCQKLKKANFGQFVASLALIEVKLTIPGEDLPTKVAYARQTVPIMLLKKHEKHAGIPSAETKSTLREALGAN